jgi:hypothetical protein
VYFSLGESPFRDECLSEETEEIAGLPTALDTTFSLSFSILGAIAWAPIHKQNLNTANFRNPFFDSLQSTDHHQGLSPYKSFPFARELQDLCLEQSDRHTFLNTVLMRASEATTGLYQIENPHQILRESLESPISIPPKSTNT